MNGIPTLTNLPCHIIPSIQENNQINENGNSRSPLKRTRSSDKSIELPQSPKKRPKLPNRVLFSNTEDHLSPEPSTHIPLTTIKLPEHASQTPQTATTTTTTTSVQPAVVRIEEPDQSDHLIMKLAEERFNIDPQGLMVTKEQIQTGLPYDIFKRVASFAKKRVRKIY